MASWLTNLFKRLFRPTRHIGTPYVWKRKGILRAASESIQRLGRFEVDPNVFKVVGLSGSAQRVYVYLSRVSDAQGYSFPFLRTIAKRTGLSKSTIGKVLGELERAGLLEIQRRYSRRGGSSNLYRLRKVAEVYPDIINKDGMASSGGSNSKEK